MDQEKAAEAVREDIAGGLKHVFTPRENGGEGPQILDTSPSSVCVEWEYDCAHTGVFQGLKPKGRELTIRGITVVDDVHGKLTFRRYVDWSEVMTQLGMFANFRPTIETHGAAAEGLPED